MPPSVYTNNCRDQADLTNLQRKEPLRSWMTDDARAGDTLSFVEWFFSFFVAGAMWGQGGVNNLEVGEGCRDEGTCLATRHEASNVELGGPRIWR